MKNTGNTSRGETEQQSSGIADEWVIKGQCEIPNIELSLDEDGTILVRQDAAWNEEDGHVIVLDSRRARMLANVLLSIIGEEE